MDERAEKPGFSEPALATPQERAVQQTVVAVQGIKTVADGLNRWVLRFDLSTAYLTAPRIQTRD